MSDNLNEMLIHLVEKTEPVASAELYGEKVDETVGSAKNSITINKKTYEFYPWGKDNKLPHKMIKCLRSNGDISNLLGTRADFLYGSGIGLFTKVKGVNEELIKHSHNQLFLDHEISELVESLIINIVDAGHGYVNVSASGEKDLDFSYKDPLTVRAVKASETQSKIPAYILSSKWDSASYVKKSGVFIPPFNYKNHYAYTESLINLRQTQTGQFYYNHPGWWNLEKWIIVANRIADRINNELDSEGNIGAIFRVAGRYFDDIMSQSPKKDDGSEYTRKEVIDAFKKMADQFLFGVGKNKWLFDICGINDKGALEKWIEIEYIKKSMTGKENNEIYLACLNAFANSSQVLGGLSGVSDGKMNSGGGTEIRETANFQQFYRTPRERKLIVNFLNRVFLPYASKRLGKGVIPEGAFYSFKNIVLETLDKNPTSAKTVTVNDN